MPVPFLIIDGYNLMHAAGMAGRRYGPGDLERRRNQLLTWLEVHLKADQRQRTTVVFDAGSAPSGVQRQSEYAAMGVVFADPGGDADTKIEQLIADHSSPRLILVVSSDHRLQKAARKRKARFTDSEPFVQLLEKRGPIGRIQQSQHKTTPRPESPKYSGQVSNDEVDAWLETFGDVFSDDELANENGEWTDYLDRLPTNLDELLDEDTAS